MDSKKFLTAEGAAAMIEQIKVNAGFQTTSYRELKSLIANSALVPGRKYRFRYSCVLDPNRPDIESLGADFDLIVEAETPTKLKAEAQAAKLEAELEEAEESAKAMAEGANVEVESTVQDKETETESEE